MDFSNLKKDEVTHIIEYSSKLIQNMPEKSLLTLTNFTGADFDLGVIDSLKTFTNTNKPYVIAGAVVGADGIKRTVFNSVLLFTGRKDLKLFNNPDEAMTWLLSL